jgi:hypothetical protein
MKKLLYWLPRLTAVIFIIFLSSFALDVFNQPQWGMALIMHLLPSFALIVITAVAWKYEALGSVLFVIAGLALLALSHSWLLVAPPILIGGLFLAGALSQHPRS